MGFLHKLWDETLAGPTPETGLAKLRKYDSFAGATSTNTTTTVPSSTPPQVVVPPLHDNSDGVSRSITILRTNSSPPFRTFSTDVPGSDPDSPSGRCSAPGTPTTPGTPGDHQNMKKYWTRRKTPVAADAFERAHNQTR
ncbi:dormancy-associated protein homolog 4 isoform X2 [Humulus lupulus]|uniref:dormancy-associated protein homolog 4 isoform X2 n=1 Tax=Humulus lupulus TaxID=3486 RepID=UPI002B4148BD|nr:dormancy-associated protein homolog 4 isoform X2 [Humulus lupulus]